MGFGDPGGWNNWTPRDHALNKLVYDEAHKKGGGNGGSGNNSGCALWFYIVFILIGILLSIHR
ncbi:MAG: hypothetical protein ACOYU3_05525 [Bacillota bacterium]